MKTAALLLWLLAPKISGDEAILPDAGATEWLVSAGYGFSVDLGPTNPSLRSFLVAPQFGKFFGRRFEYVVEANLVRSWGPSGVVGALSPLGVRLFVAGRTLRPYVFASAGVAWTDLVELEEIDTHFNFVLQAGFGGRRRIGRRDWTAEFRLFHVSNGGREGRNLGLNTVALLLGTRL